MQLERVGSPQEAGGVAGWISTNDVTLFTMVLVVVIALFLQTRLIKRSDENAKLSEHLETTSTRLDETQQQRDSARQLLESTRGELNLTKEHRDRFTKELEAAIDRIGKMNVALDGLNAEKTRLETERGELARKEQSLTQEKSTLGERVGALAAQLDAKVKALADVEQQRDRLKKQADELDAIVATLQQKLELADGEMLAARKAAETERQQTSTKIEELEKKTQSVDELNAKLRRAAEMFRGLQAEKQDIATRMEQKMLLETRVNRELVGLKGGFKRVALLVDSSGSMKQKGSGDEDRWSQAQAIMRNWLQYLDVEECSLIVFASDVRVFPEDGSMLKIRGPDGAKNRDLLLQRLAQVEPKGWTNTLDALRLAYRQKDLDTIILFSDGAPTSANSGKFQPAIAQQIYELCKQHQTVPINAIGLGNYFDQELGTFLRTVARLTDGAFLGR